MPLVVISARYFSKPAMCVCCGGQASLEIPDDGGHAGKRGDKTLSFPACSMCAAHFVYEAQRLGVVPGHNPKAPPPPRSASCEAPGRLFDYVSWSGTENTILFASPRYARSFVETNRAAGKNIVRYDESPNQVPAWPHVPRSTIAGRIVILALLALVLFVFVGAAVSRSSDPPPGDVPVTYTTPASDPAQTPAPGQDNPATGSGRHRHGRRNR